MRGKNATWTGLGLGVGLAALVVAAGCTPPTPEDRLPTAAEGRALFNANCASCHGVDADIALHTGPITGPDLRQIAARNGGTLPRVAVLSQIDGYGQDRSGPHDMPEFGALLEGDLVVTEVESRFTPVPRPLAALLFYLESVQVDS